MEPSLIVKKEKFVCEAVWETYVELGDNAYRKGFFDLAHKMFTSALIEINRPASGEVGLAETLNTLGAFYLEQEHYKKAEVLHRRALETQEELLPKDDERVAGTLILLAKSLSAESKFTLAEKHLRRSLAIVRRVYGKKSVETLEPLALLIALLKKSGGYQEAVRLDEMVFSIKHANRIQQA
ncbi:MAG TPA: tetratricopeptide repeat protein [Planktothrix sp.]